MISFRAYHAHDFHWINSLVEANMAPYFSQYQVTWSPAYYQDKLEQGEVWIALCKGEKAGFFHMSEKNGQAYLNGIQVKPHFQGQGIGQHMMVAIDRLSMAKAYQELWLKVYHNNPIRLWYERLGFSIEAKLPHQFLMKKLLS
ncbi:MAG: N-acetyltransferase [Bacteroidota bacterium]